MKRIITLLFTAALAVPALAQNGFPQDKGFHNGKDVVFNDGPGSRDYDKDGKFKDFYFFSKQEKDYQIMKINREFDYKISSVRNRMFMNRYKKEMIIRQLEDQRRDEIRRVNEKFFSKKNRWGDRNDHYSRDYNYGRNDRNRDRNW